jgi:hypothetical protein
MKAEDPMNTRNVSRPKTLKSPFSFITFIAIGLALLLLPVQGHVRSKGVFNGPPLSGGITDTLSLSNEAPGIGVISKVSCTNGTDLGGGNIRINCDSTQLPHTETSIAVDPTDPTHLIAGSIDFEILYEGGASVTRHISAYYTSFDGGNTWLNGHVPNGAFGFTSDPSVAFDRRLGLAHYGVVAWESGQGGGSANFSIQVNTSSDGGKSFGAPVVVAHGTGGAGVTLFNDKPYVAVDSHPGSAFYGRLYVTWSQFLFTRFAYIQSPIFLAFSDDGGTTFSSPKEISGSSATLCAHPIISSNTGRCRGDQFSTPVIGPNGTLYVAFENFELEGAPEHRNQYLVVRSTDGGNTFQGPFQAVGPIFDGENDYPVNIFGRQTLTNSEFRINSAGNLAVDPTSGPGIATTTLYLVFSDNRNGTLTGSSETVQTNTDVFVVRSSDGGTTWSSPNPVLTGTASQNDQFYPWAAVSAAGVLEVSFADRSYDAANIKYGRTLASSMNGVAFTTSRVDTELSNPNDSRFFVYSGDGKASFIGDYDGLDIGTDGVSHLIWTDMRTNAFPNPPPGKGHNTQDAVTAAVP